MPHVFDLRTLWIACLACLPLASAACDNGGLKGPAAEVKKSDVKLDLPAVPDFNLPPAPSDGSHTVKELRVKGKKLLDTPVTVHGFITWAYDCPTAIRKPDETDKQVQKRIDDDPTLCERPKFYIGDTKDTPPEKSLWVVDVPRPYNKLELQRIQKKDRNDPERCEPHEDPKKTVCGPYAVGDEVEISGTFSLSSPHSERNSDGLIVYKSMHNITQNWQTPASALAAQAGSAAGGPAMPSPEDLVKQHH